MTGIPEGTLWKIAGKYPELTIKFFHSRLWLVERFDDERSKSGFKSNKKKRRTGQLTKEKHFKE